MLEVEQKFKLTDRLVLSERLIELGAIARQVEHHADTYYRHPCRDFVETGEAFRIRKINAVASVTYKGPKLRSTDETLKARKEIEWCLSPGDAEGVQMKELLESLGFTPVATVNKQRESYHWTKAEDSNEPSTNESNEEVQQHFSVTIDEVEEVGLFAEVELLVADPNGVSDAEGHIRMLAERLGLETPVRESYLEMLLAGR